MPHRPKRKQYPEEWDDYIETHDLQTQLRSKNWTPAQRRHIKKVYYDAHPDEKRRKRRKRGGVRKPRGRKRGALRREQNLRRREVLRRRRNRRR